ncbi:MAG: hypothetical protein R3B91_20990 [Planctomycetaceae bacterium]
MDLIRVDSIDDQRVAVYRELHRRDLIRRSGLFIVEGQLLVERLLASSFEALHSCGRTSVIDTPGIRCGEICFRC